VEKLNAVPNAAQRHLAIVLDPMSPESIGIPLRTATSREPPVR
jgi:hypothetical protein